MLKTIIWLFLFITAGSNISFCEDRLKLREFLENSSESYSNISDYESFFYQKERIDGKLYGNDSTHLIFVKPFAVYMKFNSGDKDGVEMIFIPGRFNNRIKVRRSGFLSFMNLYLDPFGRLATANSTRTIYDVGILSFINLIEKDLNRAIELGHGNFKYVGKRRLDGRLADRFDVEFREGGYAGETARLYFDVLTQLPFKVDILNKEGEVEQMYYFKDLKINQGHSITSIDWD